MYLGIALTVFRTPPPLPSPPQKRDTTRKFFEIEFLLDNNRRSVNAIFSVNEAQKGVIENL